MTSRFDGKKIDDVAHVRGDRLDVCLWYPDRNRCSRHDVDSAINEIEVELIDVRAADNIRISYDFDRDGYVIKQAARAPFDKDGEDQDEDWAEVAFIKAWGRRVDR